jgi:Putative addiction module component
MSVTQLQAELSTLTAEEKLVLADYLVRQADETSELSTAQLGELDRRFAAALADSTKLISPQEAERRLRR